MGSRGRLLTVRALLVLFCGGSAVAPGGAAAEEGEDRCRRGLQAAAAGEHALAHALLADCDGGEAERTRRASRRELEDGAFAPVSVAVTPDGAAIEVSSFPGERFRGSRVLWLPLGEHELRIAARGRVARSETITIEDRSRLSVVIVLEAEAGAGETTIDFGEEGGAAAGDPVSTTDPGPKEHETLLPERFRRGGNAGGPQAGRDSGLSPLPFYIGGGVSLVAGALLHVAGDSDEARYAAYGLYGLGAAGLGLGVFFHVRSERRDASYALAPAPGGTGLFAAVRWRR